MTADPSAPEAHSVRFDSFGNLGFNRPGAGRDGFGGRAGFRRAVTHGGRVQFIGDLIVCQPVRHERIAVGPQPRIEVREEISTHAVTQYIVGRLLRREEHGIAPVVLRLQHGVLVVGAEEPVRHVVDHAFLLGHAPQFDALVGDVGLEFVQHLTTPAHVDFFHDLQQLRFEIAVVFLGQLRCARFMHHVRAERIGHAARNQRLAVAFRALQHRCPLELDARILHAGGHVTQQDVAVALRRQQFGEEVHERRHVARFDPNVCFDIDVRRLIGQDVSRRHVGPEHRTLGLREAVRDALGQGFERLACRLRPVRQHLEHVPAIAGVELFRFKQRAIGHQDLVDITDVNAAFEVFDHLRHGQEHLMTGRRTLRAGQRHCLLRLVIDLLAHSHCATDGVPAIVVPVPVFVPHEC